MLTLLLENHFADLKNTMKSIACDLKHFRDLIDQKIAEEEARKGEHDAYKKCDIAHNFIAHKGDEFTVCDEFTIPSTEAVDPYNRKTANTVTKGERLTVEKVDCLSIKYDVKITVFRNDCGISVTLTLDQIRKLIENDLIKVVDK